MSPAALSLSLWAACACLAASMALVGSYVALSKLLVAAIPVFLLAWLRFAIGAVAMAHWLRRPAQEPSATRETRRLLFLESFLGNFLFSVCMLYGVSLTSAVSAGIVMASLPATVAVLSRVVLREAIHARTWGAVACAAAGMGLLALAGSGPAGAHPHSGWGNLLVFGAVLCEAAYVVIGKRLTGTVGPRRITALVNLWGLALVTPWGLYQALSFDFASVPARLWVLLLFYGLAASVWSVWLWMTGLRRVPASVAGVFTVMLPVTACVVGVLALREPFSGAHAVAFALAVAGVLLATLPRAGTPAR